MRNISDSDNEAIEKRERDICKSFNKKYVLEAKHSLAILLNIVGEKNIGLFMMKWPDVVDAILDVNVDNYNADMQHLICKPLMIVADSLSDLLKSKGGIDFRQEVLIACYGSDPFTIKNNLINISNKIINKLHNYHIKYEQISNLVTKK